MFGMDEARKLLDALKEKSPQLVDGLTPQPLSLAAVTAACRALLAKGVPLKDFRRICEAMIDVAAPEVGPDQLIEGVHQRIGSLIIQNLVPVKMPLRSEEHTSELQSLMRISYAVFCLKKQQQLPN